ncbi:MAG: hypothetical protein NC420_09515 [Eubacterium sp.]|nr:hypothetical protein [Eubacterium sp.]
MSIIGSWIGAILVIICFIFLITGNIVRFIYWLKCFKIKQCQNTQCRYRQYGSKWIETYSQEDIENLYKVIEQYESGFISQTKEADKARS